MKVKAPCQPDVRPFGESGNFYRLMQDFHFLIYERQDIIRVIIRFGFRYDGASVPAIGRMILERDGVHRPAVLLHDWLYTRKGEFKDIEGRAHKFSRKECDEMMRQIMDQWGVKSWRVWVAYKAVRAFGGFYWWK